MPDKKKVLIVIDMQNDFIDGSLKNPDAKKIIPKICEYIEQFDGDVYATLDTHNNRYLDTMEGKHLPIEHCIQLTEGWCLNRDILDSIHKKYKVLVGQTIYKRTFGFNGWEDTLCNYDGYESIELVGTCTDICVISNALILKSIFPETPIIVHENMCAGSTPQAHQKAIDIMKNCHIEVRND